jgi:cell surface protein SprA
MRRERHGILLWLIVGIYLIVCGNIEMAHGQQATQYMPIVSERVEYDILTNRYIIHKTIGGVETEVPMSLTPAEYLDWSMKKSMSEYFRRRNDSVFTDGGKDLFDMTDMKFNIGPADKIFGPGGVRIRTRGSAELNFGVTYNNVQNPTLPENMRKTWGFDFDEKININVNGSVGDKVNLDMNYNTDATFDFDTKKMKLKYEGKEDEIIKLLEAGNVSMTTSNSLINGASSLFGVRADLQFGKLKLQAVISSQESESKTVSSKGGTQTTSFDISADAYDENRHFFLSHYFRDTYDYNMSKLPNILSGVTINRIEVWVTNKRGNYDNPRNIVAFADLGEADKDNLSAGAPWSVEGSSVMAPRNSANSLYQEMVSSYSTARDISAVNSVMQSISGMEGGESYEKIENARLLSSSEYTLNTSLGYISLKQTLQADEVLAVAYEYTIKGTRYQVGEFASDVKENGKSLYVKLLKSSSNSPGTATWDLMMKNVYSLNAYQVQREKFTLNITMLSDTAGVYLRYIPEGEIKSVPLLKVMGLDRLNSENQSGSNGFFDFVEGYTVTSQDGRIYFPVVEPFGSHLRKKIGDDAIADKYVFQELYDSTLTVAKQTADKDRYRLQGEYRASTANEISLGAMNVPRGSVRVTAGGETLTENSDYTVDYTMGIVTIINQNLIDAGTSISVSLESNTTYNMQRKTMLGMNFTYDFSPELQVGGTIMHLTEKPLTTKVAMGDEPLSNTLWGMNASWKRDSQWLTNMIDKLPFVEASQPSHLNLGVEFAQLVPGHGSGLQDNSSYIDDFESTQSGIDLRQSSYWQLASTPYGARNENGKILFPEASLTNNIEYGNNRAQMAWYHIDGLFTRRNSSLTPTHIRNDLEQLSNHYVREVYEQELYPEKELNYQDATTLSILNVAYYPNERGQYNLDTDLTPDGELNNPEKRWGGMMRRIETSDFETANIESLEFWLMDPFIYADGDERANFGGYTGDGTTPQDGYLYINLGDISEDILKDGKKFFENGMPVDGDRSKTEQTVWGLMPKENSLVYAFDNTSGARVKQDVGLNGLSAEEEREFSTYANYLSQIRGKVSDEAYSKFEESPSADKYHYFRGSDYDAAETSILERYKYINNTEGNSTADTDSKESYPTAAKTSPDIEDINQDNTLQETEKYYQYRIHLSPADLVVGKNYVTDKRTAKVKLRNGNSEEIAWYQFKVPLRDGESIGNIKDFKSIRFMRMFLTGFKRPVILRFGSLELVRGEWRTYTNPLYNLQSQAPVVSGTLDVSTVNIEENGDKTPVNYIMPPSITRVVDPGQPQLTQQNEQAMSLKVERLSAGDGRAVYKNSYLDLRQYRRLKMFVSAQALENDDTNLKDGELSVFIRLGSDYSSNYYEYEIPLTLTPPGRYNSSSEADRLTVWNENNNLDILLSVLTSLKKRRNTAKNTASSGVSYSKLYSEYDPDKPANKISIIGNPSLAEVKTMMIGVRNNSRSTKSAEVWVNELRLSDFNEDGGWAAQGNMNLQLSDVGSINMTGHMETAGFGGIEQSVSERRIDDYYQYQFSTSLELGRFVPKALKLTAPVYFAYSREQTSPKYNPFDTDMLLKDALDALSSRHAKDSLKNIANEVTTYRNFSLSNARFAVASKQPMPYDPANLTLSYSFTKRHNQGNTTAYENENDWRGALSYNYSPRYKAWTPFSNMRSKSNWLALIKALNLNYAPQNISFNTDMSRHYYELQLRDMDNLDDPTGIPVSVSKSFLWNRDFAIRWDLTKNLKMNFTSATHAMIEEPEGVLSRNVDPDSYEARKDTIRHSLRHFGTPIDYQQNFNASYTLPFDKIPLTDWISANASFASSYTWDKGIEADDEINLGNTISNQRSINVTTRLNMEKLYNKVPFLREANRRFAMPSSRKMNEQKPKPKRLEREVTLRRDTTVTVRHQLNSKRPVVTAIGVNGERYPVKYTVVDANTVRIDNRDSARIKLTVVQGKRNEDMKWYNYAQKAARFAMMLRNVSINYKNSYAMMLPGFAPEVGDMLGQRNGGSGMTPGLGFAFGMTGNSYIDKAVSKGWLLKDSLISAANTNSMEDIQVKMTLEPIRELKIDLSASRTRNKSTEIEFMFDGMPSTQSGNFSMSIVSLRGAFEHHSAGNGYSSSAFNKFISNIDVIHSRVQERYDRMLAATRAAETAVTNVDKYSPEVMIPAFLATYTGRNTSKSALDLFPGILSMMPNWRITYSGLSKLPFFSRHFKSVVINHAYSSTYSIGSYSTYKSFQSVDGDMGFIEDVTTGELTPSSMYNISTVSINEQFSPLIGVDMTLRNGVTAKAEYKLTRVMNLSMTANQLVESSSRDFVIGSGYKIMGLELFPGHNTKNSKSRVSNDLTLRLDLTFRNQDALCRNIQTLLTQATSGNKATKISISADYVLSRLLNVRVYYDRQKNTPLVSASSYPVISSDFGMSLKFSLNR